MDYTVLLDVAIELGYHLAMSGAETYRVEESITRIFSAYGLQAEAFAIPNCLTVSLEAGSGQPLTRMKRIGHHATDLNAVERYNQISRRICAEKPAPSIALQWIHEAANEKRTFSHVISILGSVLAASGFILVYGGSLSDGICGVICGLLCGVLSIFMNKWHVNAFFSTIISAFCIGLIANLYGILGFAVSVDGIIISSLMLLVPGLLFTNALRDIIYGDTNSGINRIVQVLLIGVAIALGTAVAWNVLLPLGTDKLAHVSVSHSILSECITTVIACFGFCIVFNIHGKGTVLCALGGGFTWAICRLIGILWPNMIGCYFIATLFAALYAEVMARIRKAPAISFLVVSIIPLLPGAGVYRTTASILTGDMPGFSNNAIQTISVAGAIAVGILIISTIARLWTIAQQKK